jgi:ABC-2 type transport system ATP-binding protein
MLLGLVRPTAGRALVGGRPYAELPRPGAQVGALLETGSLDRDRTATNHLHALALERGVRRDRVAEVLALVDLVEAADRRVRSFSLGMRQRLCLAGALLADPQVVILDEPTNGLDPAGILEFRGMVRTLVDEGRTVVLSSHLLAEVEKICDLVAIVDHGRVVAQGAIEDIAAVREKRILIATTDNDRARQAIRGHPAMGSVAAANDGLQVTLHPDVEAYASAGEINRLLVETGVTVCRLEPARASLEERFLEITTRLGEPE